jgi:hypothetical protein
MQKERARNTSIHSKSSVKGTNIKYLNNVHNAVATARSCQLYGQRLLLPDDPLVLQGTGLITPEK